MASPAPSTSRATSPPMKNRADSLESAKKCIIFAKFEIANAVITIEQSGKELIDLRGEEFKKIFPSFLANDGNKKLITILTSKKK